MMYQRLRLIKLLIYNDLGLAARGNSRLFRAGKFSIPPRLQPVITPHILVEGERKTKNSR